MRAAPQEISLQMISGVEQSEGGLATYTVSLPEGSDTSLVFADALTNEEFTGFSPGLRVPFGLLSHPWAVLDDLWCDLHGKARIK